MTHLPILIIITPLLTALLVMLVGFINKKLTHPLTVVGLGISLYSAVGVACTVGHRGPFSYRLGGWKPTVGIEYAVDHLNAMVLVVITLVAFLTAIYAKKSIDKELPGQQTSYYTLFLLQVTGLAGMTITGDAFNLYVLLEIAALTGYALIALGKGRALLSTFNYLMMGSIGASFYLLGVGYLLIKTGTLNMAGIHAQLPSLVSSQAIFVAFTLISVGVLAKMAFFPMHSWLPNAYTYAPTATSCLIAPLTTKVSVYILIRMMFTVFSEDYVFQIIQWQNLMVGLSVVAIVAGSLYALTQTHLKRMLTYLVIAEIGYMVGGAWLGNKMGLSGAIYHIAADALMTLCLFMAVGNIIYKTGKGTFKNIKGTFRKMPFTMIGFLVGAFSMIGIPPTAGFFSKWYLLSGAFQSGHFVFFGALIFSSLVNAVLFFRLIEIGFFESLPHEKPHHDHPKSSIKEAPLSMVIPLLAVSLCILWMGLSTKTIMIHFVQNAIPGGL